MANHNSLAFSDHMMFADSWLPYLVVACLIVLRKYNIWVGGLLLIEDQQNTNNQNEGAYSWFVHFSLQKIWVSFKYYTKEKHLLFITQKSKHTNLL